MSNGRMSNVVKKAECRTAECRMAECRTWPNVERRMSNAECRMAEFYNIGPP
jgi:hypothetical protein